MRYEKISEILQSDKGKNRGIGSKVDISHLYAAVK
jgi:hypothetical protein